MKPYLFFAFGHYYPNGGFSDYRGSFDSVEACRSHFAKIVPNLMSEMGFSSLEGNGDLEGHVVKTETMELVETLRS